MTTGKGHRRRVQKNGLAPDNPSESATLEIPGAGRLYCGCQGKELNRGDRLGRTLRPLAAG